MPFIEWTKDFVTGIEEVDRQHRKLVNLTNELYESIRKKEVEEVIDSILKELFNYARYHFKTEERLMEKYDYPEFEFHKKEHDKFKEKVKEFLKKRSSLKELEKEKFTIEIMKFLKDWLIKHMLGTDRRYVPFFRAKGLTTQ